MVYDINTLMPLLGALVGVLIFVGLLFYVYMALALMAVAKRLKDPQPWLAWIPVGNLVLMARLAKMHWWPVLLMIGMFIPFVNFVAMIALIIFVFIWQWKICEACEHPGWWPILQLVPFIGGIWSLIMWGILAWRE